MRTFRCWLLAAALVTAGVAARAEDWTGFRGSKGLGTSADARVPGVWSDTQNLKWKAALPGPGASSPIVVGDRVFLTCYSGYGVDRSDTGGPENLKRLLLCIGRADGKLRWTKSVAAVQPEDPYTGYLTEHGYASSTPVTDGERVYAFFGKSGVFAFDLEGNQVWHTPVGTSSSNRRWGSASSPVLYKDLLIVNASDESRSLRALDRKTGKEMWKAEGDSMELAYGTPTLVQVPNGRVELALGVPGEVWGFNPDTGKLAWFATIPMGGNICPTLSAAEGVVYVTGGFPTGGCVAVRAGGKGDVSETHVLWSSRYTSYVPTPVFHQGHLYWVDEKGTAHCLRADTGRVVYQERLNAGDGAARPKLYASPIIVGDRLIAVSRQHGAFVLAAKPAFQQVSQNRFAADDSVFNGTPAVSDGQLFLRSNRFLYCVEGTP
jgi:outer membrane protein assembly factor BamB